MSVIIIILAIVIIVGIVLIVMSPSASESVEDADEKLRIANQNLDAARAQARADQAEAIAKAEANLIDKIDARASTETATGSGDLRLDSLIALGVIQFGEMLKRIKANYVPVTKLLVIYIFIECLEDEWRDETSRLGKFARRFTKKTMTEEELEFNCLEDSVDNEIFQTPVFWASTLQNSIRNVYIGLPDKATRTQICADFSAEIAATIDDPRLLGIFCSEVRDQMNLDGISSRGAELTLSAIEL